MLGAVHDECQACDLRLAALHKIRPPLVAKLLALELATLGANITFLNLFHLMSIGILVNTSDAG